MVDYYAQRWRIEDAFRVLKSGVQGGGVEHAKGQQPTLRHYHLCRDGLAPCC